MFPLHLLYVFRLCIGIIWVSMSIGVEMAMKKSSFEALKPSLKLLIAVSLRVFTVMNLGGVVLVCEIQMLVKQGR